MTTQVQTGTIRTQIPARLDRLPWTKFHWRVILGLGTVWILDGLEVTMVGNVAARMTEDGTGVDIGAGQIGLAGSIYVIGACLGALFFGQLTDRLGRKKLFIATLAIYIVATVATAFTFAPWFFFAARFLTGSGIGGEYAAINSAIDELIPGRVRGRADLTINGSYWLGAAAGAGATVFFLNTAIFPLFWGWRVAFAVGAVLGFTIMLVRRHVPESPRWLFIHGREEEAERIVDSIESEVSAEAAEQLPEASSTITVRQRSVIPFRTIARTAFVVYPKRSILGISLFIGQAFLYNAFTFNLALLLTTFYDVPSGFTPVFYVIWALSNFLGPVLLGRLFDTLGRIPMITLSYLGSAVITVPMIVLFAQGQLNAWTFLGFILGIFFLASSGASAAYLTVSEVFPMETRALAIAFFYAVGTAAGGIAGPLLFGTLIESEQRGNVMIAFIVGAAVMAVGGIAELFLGVRSERASLEDIAKPLTAQEAEEGGGEQDGAEGAGQESDEQREARNCRHDAERERARASDHRARSLELQAQAARTPAPDGTEAAAAESTSGTEGDGAGSYAEQQRAEEALAELAELRAAALDEQTVAHELLAEAGGESGEHARAALRARAQAAEQRASGYAERARAADSESAAEGTEHDAYAAAADERSRAREQWALAERTRADAASDEDGGPAVAAATAEMHEYWAARHEATAQEHDASADGDDQARQLAERRAAEQEQLALAAEQRVSGAEHTANADAERSGLDSDDGTRQQDDAREREALEREERIRERVRRRESAERSGLRRFAPGPGRITAGRRSGGLDEQQEAEVEQVLDQEIQVLSRALSQHGAIDRAELARLVGARYWGPGRFGHALRAAVNEGWAQRLSRRTYGPPE